MANLRGNSLVGGKPIVTIDMLNKFVEDIQAAQRDEMMHKYEREVITSNQVVDAYIKDKSKNGVWLCSNVQDFPMYNYGTLLNFSTGSSRLQLYAPHKKASSDKYHDNAGLFFRTGWDSDIKDWQQAASVNYVNDKDNEIKEEINNSLKTEQYLSYEGNSIVANNTLEGRTEEIKIKGKTLFNLAKISKFYKAGTALAIEEKTTNSYKITSSNEEKSSMVVMMPSNVIKKNTEYTLIFNCETNLDGNSLVLSFKVNDKYTENGQDIPNKNGFNITKITSPNKDSTDFVIGRHGEVSKDKYIKISNMIILEGDFTNEKIPNYFEGIKSFGEAEQEGDKYKISILSTGRNLIDDSIKSNTEIDYNTGDERLDNKIVTTDYFTPFFQNNKNLYAQILVNGIKFFPTFRWYDKNKKYINGHTLDEGIPKNARYLRMRVLDSQRPINSNDCKFLLIENSDKNLNYEPYKCDKKDILIKEPLRENDVLYENDGQIKVYRQTKQYTFTGDENWRIMSQPDNSYIYFEVNFNSKKSDKINIICDNFIPRSFSELYAQNIDGISAWSDKTRGTIFVGMEKSKLSTQDVEGLKAWLRENPTTIVYELATPIIEIVESCIDLNLATFKGKNYINIGNNIKGNMELKIPTNIYSMINSHSKNINKLFNKLEQSFYIRTILINEWQQSHDAFKYTIKHNLGTRLIANVAATKVDGMSTNIDYKIVDENTIEIYVIDKAQLDIIIKTI